MGGGVGVQPVMDENSNGLVLTRALALGTAGVGGAGHAEVTGGTERATRQPSPLPAF